MKSGVFLAFDVGGTYIKSGALDAEGRIIEAALQQYESKADGAADEIISRFVDIVVDVIGTIPLQLGERIRGIGYAFPGPFDYVQGISYIRGLDKFEALYGVNVGESLQQQLWADPRLKDKLEPSMRIRFENDASLFALGEAHFGHARGAERAVCLTIGTGLGSGFIESGALVTEGDGVPDNGWIYHLPYRSSIADDYISRRGFLALAAEVGIDLQRRDVKEFAQSAMDGETWALALFEAFGVRMAEVLADTFRLFRPDVVVLGGQISKSGALFIPAFVGELAERGVTVPIAVSEHTLRSTLQGIYYMLSRR